MIILDWFLEQIWPAATGSLQCIMWIVPEVCGRGKVWFCSVLNYSTLPMFAAPYRVGLLYFNSLSTNLSITNATIITGGILNHGFLVSANLGGGSHEFPKPLESHQKNAEWNAVTILENFTTRNDWSCGLHLESPCDITLFRKGEQLRSSLNTSWERSNTRWAISVLKWTLHIHTWCLRFVLLAAMAHGHSWQFTPVFQNSHIWPCYV